MSRQLFHPLLDEIQMVGLYDNTVLIGIINNIKGDPSYFTTIMNLDYSEILIGDEHKEGEIVSAFLKEDDPKIDINKIDHFINEHGELVAKKPNYKLNLIRAVDVKNLIDFYKGKRK